MLTFGNIMTQIFLVNMRSFMAVIEVLECSPSSLHRRAYLTGSLEKAGCETCGNPDVNVLYCFITGFILMHGLSTLRF